MNQKQAKELVRSRLSDKRYEHTLNVKKMAVRLAKRYGVDEDKAALAALLHDSAKEISKDEMRELMRQYPQYAEGGEERMLIANRGEEWYTKEYKTLNRSFSANSRLPKTLGRNKME